jgi:hypothetical protein
MSEINNNIKIIKENITNKKLKKKENEELVPSKEVIELDYKYFFKNNVSLIRFKLDDLKYIAKKNSLRFSGKKQVLVSRIELFFNKTKNAIKIQSNYKRYIVQKSIFLRGPALKNRKICVNDTDFVSMEPLIEIPNEFFYSYQDDKGFVYGFNITSLVQILQTKNKFNNPYNREPMDNNIRNNVIKLYNLSYIIYPSFRIENDKNIMKDMKETNNLQNRNTQNIVNNHNNILNDTENINNNIFQNYNPEMINTIVLTDDQQNRIARLVNIRNMTITQRINNLFIEFDYLGNYTQSNWFNLLERVDYLIMYRFIYDLWYYRGNLTRNLRYNICPFVSPFYNLNNNVRNNINNLTTEELKMLCLIIFENLVYTGSDDEYRKIGAFHALTSLTIVSIGARIAMPWLYDSVSF